MAMLFGRVISSRRVCISPEAEIITFVPEKSADGRPLQLKPLELLGLFAQKSFSVVWLVKFDLTSEL